MDARIAMEQPLLLERVRAELRLRHYSRNTEVSYVQWVHRFVRFHKKHPQRMGAREISAFLTHLALEEEVSASTQNQALNALVFLYEQVLGRDVGSLEGLVRAHKPRRLPVVLSVAEVRAVLEQLDGVPRIVASLLYGSGCASSNVSSCA